MSSTEVLKEKKGDTHMNRFKHVLLFYEGAVV